jgi:hypothetical protein
MLAFSLVLPSHRSGVSSPRISPIFVAKSSEVTPFGARSESGWDRDVGESIGYLLRIVMRDVPCCNVGLKFVVVEEGSKKKFTEDANRHRLSQSKCIFSDELPHEVSRKRVNP